MCMPTQLRDSQGPYEVSAATQRTLWKTQKFPRATMMLRNSPEGNNLGSHWLYWNAIGPSQAEVSCSRGREKRPSLSEDKRAAVWKGNGTKVAWG